MANPFAARNKALRDAVQMADSAVPSAPVAKKPTEWSGRTESEIGQGYKRLAPSTTTTTVPSDAQREFTRRQKAVTGKVIGNDDL
jgi:hypothetical protein